MSSTRLLLNCDLGEGEGVDTPSLDATIMPYLDQANIACGFHAGDPLTLKKTISLAVECGVSIGAHPSYPDRENFGRVSMRLHPEELLATLHYQIAALDGMVSVQGADLTYVKPHGALYNDMMQNAEIRATVMKAVASYGRPLKLVLQATPDWQRHESEAEKENITLQFEAFADRRYLASGALQPRSEQGSVLDSSGMLDQVLQLLTTRQVSSADGGAVSLRADTLCIHGDNPHAGTAVQAIRKLIVGG